MHPNIHSSTIYNNQDMGATSMSIDRLADEWIESGLCIYMASWWLSSKESVCKCRDLGSILGSGRFPGGGNGNPLQYSSLGNPMDRGAWWAIVQGLQESDTT